MSTIEKSRADLKISGYVHPTSSASSSTKNSYKSFNTDSKKNDYISSRPKSAYAKFTDKDSINQANGCPECGKDALYACECEFHDKQCSNGHVWYINRKGKIKLGDPHE
jgi:hypothetical protein